MKNAGKAVTSIRNSVSERVHEHVRYSINHGFQRNKASDLSARALVSPVARRGANRGDAFTLDRNPRRRPVHYRHPQVSNYSRYLDRSRSRQTGQLLRGLASRGGFSQGCAERALQARGEEGPSEPSRPSAGLFQAALSQPTPPETTAAVVREIIESSGLLFGRGHRVAGAGIVSLKVV
jgi:hypothetical protein